ncbi:CYTH domain-containing protein [Microbacterium sp. YY-01]|uniref:CYTH domain-containing protein n=1 Tax=Microbacterium sp. YY-01 TaxID=3421634 RepID=UPI003D1734E7
MASVQPHDNSAHTSGERSIEIERKYDVDPSTALPDWLGCAGISAVSEAEERHLDAVYFDTPDAALAQSGTAVRRRTGGPDEGWHVKGPRRADGRVEVQWPLSDEKQLPQGLIAHIHPIDAETLTPLARIQNDRVAFQLSTAAGVIAEFVDDHVTATDLRTGVQRQWREWEIELGPAAPTTTQQQGELFAAVEQVVMAVGGRPSASGSKLARALGA